MQGQGAVDWIQDKVPAWILILLAGVGTPTSIGSVIWLQNGEAKMAVLTREVASMQEAQRHIWAEMALRVRTTERLEMKAELDRRLDHLEDRLERLDALSRPNERPR